MKCKRIFRALIMCALTVDFFIAFKKANQRFCMLPEKNVAYSMSRLASIGKRTCNDAAAVRFHKKLHGLYAGRPFVAS